MSTTTTTASDSGGVERSPGGNRRKIILSAADTEATVQKLTAELQAACAAGESTRIAELSTQLAQMAVAAAKETEQLKALVPPQMALDGPAGVVKFVDLFVSAGGTKPGKPKSWVSWGGKDGSYAYLDRFDVLASKSDVQVFFAEELPHALSGEVVPPLKKEADAAQQHDHDAVRHGGATHAEKDSLVCVRGSTAGYSRTTSWKPAAEGMLMLIDLLRSSASGGSSSNSNLKLRCLEVFAKLAEEGGEPVMSMTGAMFGGEIHEVFGEDVNIRSYDLFSNYAIAEGDEKRGKGIDGPDPKLNKSLNEKNAEHHLRRDFYDPRLKAMSFESQAVKDQLFLWLAKEKKAGRTFLGVELSDLSYSYAAGHSMAEWPRESTTVGVWLLKVPANEEARCPAHIKLCLLDNQACYGNDNVQRFGAQMRHLTSQLLKGFKSVPCRHLTPEAPLYGINHPEGAKTLSTLLGMEYRTFQQAGSALGSAAVSALWAGDDIAWKQQASQNMKAGNVFNQKAKAAAAGDDDGVAAAEAREKEVSQRMSDSHKGKQLGNTNTKKLTDEMELQLTEGMVPASEDLAEEMSTHFSNPDNAKGDYKGMKFTITKDTSIKYKIERKSDGTAKFWASFNDAKGQHVEVYGFGNTLSMTKVLAWHGLEWKSNTKHAQEERKKTEEKKAAKAAPKPTIAKGKKN